MRRAALLVCALALAVMGLTAAGTASAVSVATTNCDHYSGGGIYPRDAAFVYHENGTRIGAVQVCKDSDSRYWGYVVLYNPLPARTWAQVHLERWYRGEVKVFTCDSDGGNDHVAPGQTRCWTPKLQHPSTSVTFAAWAEVCTGYYPSCENEYGHGDTWPPVH